MINAMIKQSDDKKKQKQAMAQLPHKKANDTAIRTGRSSTCRQWAGNTPIIHMDHNWNYVPGYIQQRKQCIKMWPAFLYPGMCVVNTNVWLAFLDWRLCLVNNRMWLHCFQTRLCVVNTSLQLERTTVCMHDSRMVLDRLKLRLFAVDANIWIVLTRRAVFGMCPQVRNIDSSQKG